MATKFIKVTPKGETAPRIVLATLKPFYLSQGAKIEEPTPEEVYAAEPTERPAAAPAQPTTDDQLNAAFEEQKRILEEDKARLQQALNDLQAESARLKEQIAANEEKIKAQDTAIAEAEKVIENLKKELKKAEK